jgi:hypothetical protein
MTSLETLTERVIAAAQTENLEALAQALTDREAALRDVSSYSPEQLAAAHQGGEIAVAAVQALKQRLQSEHGRLSLMRDNFLEPCADDPLMELHG